MAATHCKVKRIYIRYELWEDYVNGMWRKLPPQEEAKMLTKCIEFTGNHIEYGQAMKEVVLKWNNTMLNSLTNAGINRRAFLGQCACQFKINCPEYITRIAWKHLTNEQRYLADKVAQSVVDSYLIKIYENTNRAVYKDMAKQMLLEWHS